MITSLQNDIVKNVVRLSNKKERNEQGLFVAEGIKVCKTLINDGLQLVHLLLTPPHVSDFKQESLIVAPKITLVTEAVLKKISQFSTPSGVIGIFRIKKTNQQQVLTEGLVLYNVQDPGNVGTLMRTCAAMGSNTVVFINSVDPYHPKVVQAASGTLAHLNIFICEWSELLAKKRQENFRLGALIVKEGKNPAQVNFKKLLLVVGNESNGLRKEIINQCDEHITLTMPGSVESLNVAVAGSIALYLAANSNN